jgi:hypothetical protein
VEKWISPVPFETDSTVAYIKDVPDGALPYAEVGTVGGMTRKSKNLFIASKVNKTVIGLTMSYSNGLIKINGTKTDGANVQSIAYPNVTLPAGTYTISCKMVGGSITPSESFQYGVFFAINKSDYAQRTTPGVAKVGDVGTRVVTLSEPTVISSFDIIPDFGGVGTVFNNALFEMQFEIGDTVTTYEDGYEGLRSALVTKVESVGANLWDEQQEHTLPIPAAVQNLDGYGWGMNESVYNYIDWEKKQFVKRVEKLILFGGTTWTPTGSTGLYNASLMNNAKKHNNSAVYALCSDIPYTGSYLSSYFISRVNNDRGLQFNNVLSIYGLSANTSAAFNAYLVLHPMTFVYELEEPIVTDISDLITDDNLIGVESHGTLTFENEYGFGVPSDVTYQIKEVTA